MNRSIVRLITAPAFADERKTRTADLVNSSLLVVLVGAVLFPIVAAVFSRESNFLVNLTTAMAVVAMIGLKVLLHRGSVQLAGTLLSLTIWMSFTICKKVRDDNGYWNQIDAYIEEHSEVDISHSICPECAEKYFPEMDLYGD